MQECRNTILRLFNKRFSHVVSSELLWASYLDPRVAKYMNHLSDEQIPSARKKLIIAAAQLARDEIELTNRGIFLPETVKKKVSSSFVSTFVFGPDDAAIPNTNLEKDCSDEFTRYLADITAPNAVTKATKPCNWWGINQKKYPNLSKLARKWLGIVATSVPSERAFSTSGSIVTVKRGSLASNFVRDIVFIAENTRQNEESGVTGVVPCKRTAAQVFQRAITSRINFIIHITCNVCNVCDCGLPK
ncbi:unnamed protein product [Phytophthora fragariaefolia]|uniref:Unnamed protein product n=1 Tax=Phytophthora fragariaefolia TaxID=1490495 RepID=A0A9W6U5L3_9STRA|nr:unnamed protein product [Phytophthora fragariaefolia]